MGVSVFRLDQFETSEKHGMTVDDSGIIKTTVDTDETTYLNSDYLKHVSDGISAETVTYSGSVTNQFMHSRVMGVESSMTQMKGEGYIELSPEKESIQMIELDEHESVTLLSEYVLAVIGATDIDLSVVGGLWGVYHGGKVVVTFDGSCTILIGTDTPIELFTAPVKTDPSETIGWDGERVPRVDADILGLLDDNWTNYKLNFRHDGFVLCETEP